MTGRVQVKQGDPERERVGDKEDRDQRYRRQGLRDTWGREENVALTGSQERCRKSSDWTKRDWLFYSGR